MYVLHKNVIGLYLGGNRIEELPETIGELTQLEYLDLKKQSFKNSS